MRATIPGHPGIYRLQPALPSYLRSFTLWMKLLREQLCPRPLEELSGCRKVQKSEPRGGQNDRRPSVLYDLKQSVEGRGMPQVKVEVCRLWLHQQVPAPVGTI